MTVAAHEPQTGRKSATAVVKPRSATTARPLGRLPPSPPASPHGRVPPPAAALIRDVTNSLASNVRDTAQSVFDNVQDPKVKSALRGLQLV